MNTILDRQITYLNNVKKPENFKIVKLGSALQDIKNGKYKDLIEQLEALFIIGDDAGYKKLKSALPSHCFHGTFENTVTNAGFKDSSDMVLGDIDDLIGEQLLKTKNMLANDPHIVFIHTSVSGAGLKVAFYVTPGIITDDTTFKLAFAQIERYLADKGVVLDPSGKDVRRLSFVGFDKNLYYNKNPEAFPLTLTAPIQTPLDTERDVSYTPITEYDTLTSPLPDITLDNATDYLPIAGEQTYAEWLETGMALYHQFEGSVEGRAIFDTWSQNVREYKGIDDIKKIWKTLGKRTSGPMITFRSLIASHKNQIPPPGRVDEWGASGEIQSNTPPVQALHPELIPEPLRSWLADVSHGKCQNTCRL